jgi:hypothetical protein
MKSKHLVNALLLICFVGMLGWFWWRAPAVVESLDGQPSQLADESISVAGETADFQSSDQPVAAQLDPATMQAVLAAIAELEQQQQAQAAEDARIDRVVRNNLRQLAQGADQYFTERGVSSVTSVALVGTNSSQYVKTFFPAAGETYPPIILQGQPIISSRVAGERDITLAP